MHIESNQAELDEQRGVSIYTGNVRVTQGTLVLTGEHMTVYNDGEHLDRMILLGTPATYRQRPDGKDEDMRAEALRMEYHAEPERVILLEKAVAWQGENSFRSDRIVYQVRQDRVEAGATEGGQRVHIILQPRPKPEGQAAE
jgi:lipopolysaccharide export system protein LptA